MKIRDTCSMAQSSPRRRVQVGERCRSKARQDKARYLEGSFGVFFRDPYRLQCASFNGGVSSAIDSPCYGRSKPVRPCDDDCMTGRLGNKCLAACGGIGACSEQRQIGS